MKKAIFTLAIGDNPMYQAAILSFQHYADKVGADVIISDSLHYPINIENPKHSASPAWAEKLRIGELLKEYDRVLYVDADILISPNARDIFKEYDDPDCIYMLNEGAHCDRSLEKSLIEQQLGEVDWPKVNGQPDYYNVGVMLLSQSHQLFSYCDLPLLQSVCNHIRFYEQTVFNYQIFKQQLKHSVISASFNRMDMFGEEGYLGADFIHYAGKGYAKNNRRRDVQFLKDFAQLYAGIVSEEDIKRLKAQAWQQYLNKIYKKYPLPSFLLKVLCERNVPH